MAFKHNLLSWKEIDAVSTPRGRFYETPLGAFPSVTTILSAKETPWLEEWKERVGEVEAEKIKNEAATRGTRLHNLNEKFLLNQDIEWKKTNMITKSHFLQIKPWMVENIEEVLGCEIPIYSRKLKCAGRTDAIVKVNGKIVVLDFKTSKHYKEEIDSYRLQCSAYVYMMNELYDLGIEDYVVLISNLNENFPSVFTGNYRDHIKEFLELRNKWNRH